MKTNFKENSMNSGEITSCNKLQTEGKFSLKDLNFAAFLIQSISVVSQIHSHSNIQNIIDEIHGKIGKTKRNPD